MLLIINTSQDKYRFGLFAPNFGLKEFSVLRDDKKDTLYFIDKFLQKNNLTIRDLKAVAVYNGKGSYTGVRVGVTIANALSYSLNIPVFGFQYKSMSDKTKKEIWEKILKKKYETDNFVRVKY